MKSYALLRRLAHGGKIAVSLSYDAEQLDREEDYEGVVARELDAALTAEGLKRSGPVRVDSFHVGRSAGGVELLFDVGSKVVVIVGGLKILDEGAKVIRKWARALKRLREKWRTVSFSVEALKLLCLDDLIERYAGETSPVLDLLTHHVGAAPVFDGQWQFATPVYISIPDEARRCTHLYVVSKIGEILHRAEFPAFELEGQAKRFQLEPATELAEEEDPHPHDLER